MLLEGEIREAMENNEYLVAVSFDLMRAYDLTWRRQVVEELLRAGMKGQMVRYVMNLLEGRKVKTVMGGLESSEVSQDTGLVTGTVISVTLFLLVANLILQSIPAGTKKLMFADDLTIFVRGQNLTKNGEVLQNAIDAIAETAKNIGFSFSVGKTIALTFSRKNKPDLYLEGLRITYKDEHKILGMIFDRKLSWKSHVQYVADRAKKRLNIMRMLSNVKFGVSRHHMITLYQNVVLSVIEYGSTVYVNAPKTTLKMLDSIHLTGLRIALGAFKSSPVENIKTQFTSFATFRLGLESSSGFAVTFI